MDEVIHKHYDPVSQTWHLRVGRLRMEITSINPELESVICSCDDKSWLMYNDQPIRSHAVQPTRFVCMLISLLKRHGVPRWQISSVLSST